MTYIDIQARIRYDDAKGASLVDSTGWSTLKATEKRARVEASMRAMGQDPAYLRVLVVRERAARYMADDYPTLKETGGAYARAEAELAEEHGWTW